MNSAHHPQRAHPVSFLHTQATAQLCSPLCGPLCPDHHLLNQMRVREASDEQKAEQNDGGSGSGVWEREDSRVRCRVLA